MKPFDIEFYLSQGERRKWKEADLEYGSNAGKLRGGNSGVLDADGNVYGHCHRISLLDYLGINPSEPDAPLRRMFEAGHWNEDYLVDKLDASDLRADGYEILREEEGQFTWSVTTPEGRAIEGSGRADILVIRPHEDYIPPMRLSSGDVIPAKNYTPVFGIEAKKISSQWRTDQVYDKDDPSNDYLTQGANYSYRAGRVTWSICFSNYDNHSTYKRKKIEPGRRYFYITWQDDQVFVNDKPTVITGAGIDAYYALIPAMEEAKDLGPRPSNESVIYGGIKQWDQCSRCPLKDVCDRYENNYEDWLTTVKHLVGKKD